MTEKSKSRKECSLFVVQYVPDLVRGEFVNIGLFLHSPEERYLGCLFTDDFRRIRRFHPNADVEFLRQLQQDFEQQIDEHGDDLEGYLAFMQNSFSNLIQLTAPRACTLDDPQTEIQDLFARYVGARLSGPSPQDTRLRIKQRLTTAFVRAGVWEKLDKRVPASAWTHAGDPFTFDYGYKPLFVEGLLGHTNGRIKFVHALSLKRDNELAAVLKDRILKVRAKEPADLVTVVEALPGAPDATARSTQTILEEAAIRIQPLAGLDGFAQSVRRELMV